MTDREHRREHDDRLFLLLVVIAGLAIRLLWLAKVHGIDAFLDASEATRVAIAIATSGSVADAYYVGQGPTAHLLPLSPGIAGGIMGLFGPGSTAADLTLLAWSLGQVTVAYLLWRQVFERFGADPAVVRWGTAALFLLPPFVPQETVDFRYWEGGAALALAGLNLLLIERLDRRRTMKARDMVVAGLVSAVTLFLCPPVGLAVDLCWAIVALRRLSTGHAARFAACAAAALALLVTPWALRNLTQFGTPILLRSNAGLELAIANHPAALSARPPERVFAERIRAIHPAANPALRTVIAQPGGEVRYARTVGAAARAWMADNPIAAVRLALRHLREFFLPRAWQMYFTGWEGARVGRAGTIALVNALGLLGLAIGLVQRRRGYALLAIYVAGIALPYALFQPMARYIFLIWAPMAYLAVAALVAAARAAAAGPVTAR